VDLQQLSNLLINIGSPHAFLVQEFEHSVVYHYTDLNALNGILASRDLWLTNSQFSNDSEEIEHGRTVVENAVARRLQTKQLSGGEGKFLEQVAQQLKQTVDRGAYVCCFCFTDDLLSQWRSYGANSTGVSLALATRAFQSIAGPDMPPDPFGLVYLWRVFYNEEKQRQIVDECLRYAWEHAHGSLDEKTGLATAAIRFFVPTFKNEDFKEEQEARLVFLPAPGCQVALRFRVARGMLVPYFSLREIVSEAGQANWELPVQSVRIGCHCWKLNPASKRSRIG
jgi:hypothetical protein